MAIGTSMRMIGKPLYAAWSGQAGIAVLSADDGIHHNGRGKRKK
jgi:hypothetical protein